MSSSVFVDGSSHCTPPTDPSLSSVWMLLFSNPIFDKLFKASVQQGENAPKGKSLSRANNLLTRTEEDSLLEWTLAVCVLREGHRLLDGAW